VIQITHIGALRHIRAIAAVPDLFRCEVNAMGENTNARLINPAVILVATDLSDLHRIGPFAIQMAEKTGARLELLHILQLSGEFTTDAAGIPCYDREGAFSIAMSMLEPWCERARKLGLSCEPVVREGHSAAQEIISAVRQLHADRILLGTRSRGKLGKLLLGSIAEQVLRSASLPVFTIGPEAHLPSENQDHLPTVLFATSLGEGHHAGAALACQIAASQQGKLIMLHVLPPLVEKPGNGAINILYPTILYELRLLANRVGAESCRDVEVKVIYGNPAEQILAECTVNQADLIVMHTNDRPKFHSVLHDRTICRVLTRAQCPVLTLNMPHARPVQPETEELAIHG
jgi:nucleotide-binding universal stress UspA family protein